MESTKWSSFLKADLVMLPLSTEVASSRNQLRASKLRGPAKCKLHWTLQLAKAMLAAPKSQVGPVIQQEIKIQNSVTAVQEENSLMVIM